MAKKLKKPSKSMLDIISYRNITEDCFIQQDDESFVDVMQILPRNILKSNIDEREIVIERFAQFFRGCKGDYKLVIMNYPTDTSTQRRNIEAAIERTSNPTYLHFLEQKLTEMQKITSNIPTCEYYLFVFANNITEIEHSRETAISLLNSILAIKQLSADKKINIIRKMCDLNATILEV